MNKLNLTEIFHNYYDQTLSIFGSMRTNDPIKIDRKIYAESIHNYEKHSLVMIEYKSIYVMIACEFAKSFFQKQWDIFSAQERSIPSLLFCAYFETALAIINFCHFQQVRQKENNIDIDEKAVQLISQIQSLDPQRSGILESIYIEILERYRKIERDVSDAELFMNNNINDNKFRFRMKSAAVYHYYKHSIEDVYETEIRTYNNLITPGVYLDEANYTIQNGYLIEELNWKERHEGKTTIDYIFEKNDEYEEHLRRCVINRKDKEIISYYKQRLI